VPALPDVPARSDAERLELELKERRERERIKREKENAYRRERRRKKASGGRPMDVRRTAPNKAAVADSARDATELAVAKKQVKRKRKGPDRFGKDDRALFSDITNLMDTENLSVEEAAGRLGDKIKRRGSLESAKRRVARRYREEVLRKDNQN
jgi:hypothetical protein